MGTYRWLYTLFISNLRIESLRLKLFCSDPSRRLYCVFLRVQVHRVNAGARVVLLKDQVRI